MVSPIAWVFGIIMILFTFVKSGIKGRILLSGLFVVCFFIPFGGILIAIIGIGCLLWLLKEGYLDWETFKK